METQIQWLALALGWAIVVLIALYGAIIAFRMVDGTINLEKLISEDNGSASLSRFQFLIFTFTIAGGVLLGLIASLRTEGIITFPHIPGELLGLLGISGTSYVVAKGIQKQSETK